MRVYLVEQGLVGVHQLVGRGGVVDFEGFGVVALAGGVERHEGVGLEKTVGA